VEDHAGRLELDPRPVAGEDGGGIGEGGQAVEALAFDELVRRSGRVRLAKLDCEGAEWEILPSLSKQSLNRVKHVLLECHAQADGQLDAMLEQLEAAGFRVRILSTASAPGLYRKLATIWGERP
jgi:hypothetical protein